MIVIIIFIMINFIIFIFYRVSPMGHRINESNYTYLLIPVDNVVDVNTQVLNCIVLNLFET